MSVIRTPGGLSVRFRPRALGVGAGAALLAAGFGLVALGSGDYPMGPADVLRTLTGGGTVAEQFIVYDLRLPRLVTALLVGAALALAGTVFQSLVRNPLGSPDILGFTQGASTGALVVVVLGGSSLALAGAAVAGGLGTGLLIYALAWRRGVHGYRLILVGIGVAAILTGVNGYLLTRAPLMDAARAVLWLTGSLDGRGWANAGPLLAVLVVLAPLVLVGCAPALRMMELGDDAASALGVPVRRLRLALLAAAVLLVSFAAAAAGPVSFVALVAPHVAKRLTRAPGPNLVPSMTVGAALLAGADLLAQRAFDGHQLPVGVVTGVIGGGYLVWLLAVERRAGRL
ncbi:iron chelate uptake ABC transporter family permease subunit [Micromonospora parva]|uniref:FecCD family ABC transporter permease n=1 Tax=Micromonospora parva TaxID=1464048 RepID=A0ABW6VZH3_9ACTN|nr:MULTISPECIES: iron chelate uptake ABC transporter family permease subunit [Micromonospora]MBQ1033939.1 iron chelate uptake ABC transporter family permease subunit [Micromonospora sp. C97]